MQMFSYKYTVDHSTCKNCSWITSKSVHGEFSPILLLDFASALILIHPLILCFSVYARTQVVIAWPGPRSQLRQQISFGAVQKLHQQSDIYM